MPDPNDIIPDHQVEKIDQDGVEKDPTHDHDPESLDDAADKMAVDRDKKKKEGEQ